eukprot:SAG22_NODE_205_length_15308_cov_20.539023_28_plen_44_part_00
MRQAGPAQESGRGSSGREAGRQAGADRRQQAEEAQNGREQRAK